MKYKTMKERLENFKRLLELTKIDPIVINSMCSSFLSGAYEGDQLVMDILNDPRAGMKQLRNIPEEILTLMEEFSAERKALMEKALMGEKP